MSDAISDVIGPLKLAENPTATRDLSAAVSAVISDAVSDAVSDAPVMHFGEAKSRKSPSLLGLE